MRTLLFPVSFLQLAQQRSTHGFTQLASRFTNEASNSAALDELLPRARLRVLRHEIGAVVASSRSPHVAPPSAEPWKLSADVVQFAPDRKYLPYAFTEHGAILSAIGDLMHPKVSVPKRRPIGFTADLEKKS